MLVITATIRQSLRTPEIHVWKKDEKDTTENQLKMTFLRAMNASISSKRGRGNIILRTILTL